MFLSKQNACVVIAIVFCALSLVLVQQLSLEKEPNQIELEEIPQITPISLENENSTALQNILKAPGNDSTLIVFAYAPGEFRDPNLEYFIRKGGLIDKPNYFFVFIASGAKWKKTKYFEWINKFPNTGLMERENTGFDSCAWKDVLNKYKDHFSRFILLNGSVRGPFLPVYAKDVMWPELFLEPFKNGNPNDIGLSGTTLNCQKNVHIQSMLIAFTRDTLDTLYNSLGCFTTKLHAIGRGEIAYSQNMLKMGKNLKVLATFWKDHDFRNATNTAKKCQEFGTNDSIWPHAYQGMDYHPYELVFIKTNRNIAKVEIDRFSNWKQKSPQFEENH
jgi:hypothetical protein